MRAALGSTTPLTGLSLRATSYVLHGETAASGALRAVVAGEVTGASAGPANAVAAFYTLDGKPVTGVEKGLDVR